MLSFFRKFTKNKSNRVLYPINRTFSPKYFLNKFHQEQYESKGYTVIKGIVEEEEIKKFQEAYTKLTEFNAFKIKDEFTNSGRFQSIEIRQYVVNFIRENIPRISDRIFNSENCQISNGGNFQIKPASKNSVLNPHQDSPIINEYEFYATYIWIPLQNISPINGALTVLPGSHLWGNYQRGLNVQWPLEKYSSLLNKNMITINVSVGDVICFDSALIHASLPNLSKTVRVAVTSSALPRNYKLMEYFKDEHTPEGQVEVYEVNEDYYVNQNILTRPVNYPKRYEPINQFITNINKKELKALLNK